MERITGAVWRLAVPIGNRHTAASRAFSRLARLGLITVCLRVIVLLDRHGLLDITTLPAGLPTFECGLRDNFIAA